MSQQWVGLSHAWPSIPLTIHTTLFVVAGNSPHMTMTYSMEYTIQKNDINPLSNIGRAYIDSHFAYPKS